MNKQHTVLILDDEEIIRIALKETIASEGYRVIVKGSGQEALEVLKKEKVSVILSDQRMPAMTGLEFLSEAKKIQPHTARILITGVVNLKTVINAVNDGEVYRFLAKPWIREDLLITIKNAIHRYELLIINEKLQQDVISLNDSITKTNQELNTNISNLKSQNKTLEITEKSVTHNFDLLLNFHINHLTEKHAHLSEIIAKGITLLKQIESSGQLSQDEIICLKYHFKLHYIQCLSNSEIFVSFIKELQGNLAYTSHILEATTEHFDGTGTPHGLKQDEIPKLARLLSIIIFYIESKQGKEHAIENILKASGTFFDPHYVRLFLKITRQVKPTKEAQTIDYSQLRPGMILAENVRTPSGLSILEEGFCLDKATINKIRRQFSVFKKQHSLLVFSHNE